MANTKDPGMAVEDEFSGEITNYDRKRPEIHTSYRVLRPQTIGLRALELFKNSESKSLL